MKRVVVYFPNWATYNAATNNFNVSMIPWDKISVVNHAFFTVDATFKMATIDSFADFEKQFEHSGDWTQTLKGHLGEYKYYKSVYPDKKVLISIGGWTRGENFHAMALTAANRAIFIQSIIDFFKAYPFIDGIDIDWEYPGINREKDPNDQYDRGCPGGPEDTKNYTALLQEIRAAYVKNNMSEKLLTVAASAGYEKLLLQEPNIYYQYLDFINVMTYDFHGAWENITNHLAPLYVNPADPSPTSPVDIKNQYNTQAAMKIFTDTYNIPGAVLNVGAPFYSRGWKNVDGSTGQNGLFANAGGAPVGNLDDAQNPGGQNSYQQMKILENTTGYVKYRDDIAKVPYLYNASQKIMYTYEDEQSLSERCDFTNNNGYGGMLVWDISNDNPSGYPMTTIIYNKLAAGKIPPAAAAISVDNAINTGTYNITITVAAGNTGNSLSLYENNVVVKSQAIIPNNNAEQKITYTVTNKPPGTYVYRCDVKNEDGTTPSDNLMVTVNNPAAAPAPAVLSVDHATNSGNYTVTVTIPAGDTATSMILYENNSAVKSQNLTISTNAQISTYAVTNKAAGSYTYLCDLSNVNGLVHSQPLNVIVQSGPAVAEWVADKAYTAGDLTSYQGHVYKCIQAHTSQVGWEPPNVPALWQLQQ
jgi:chitinase